MIQGAGKLAIPQDLSGCQALIERLANTVDSLTAKVSAQSATVDSQSAEVQSLTVKVSSQAARVEALTAQVEELNQKKLALELELAEVLQWALRKRSERYINDPNQLKIDFGDSVSAHRYHRLPIAAGFARGVGRLSAGASSAGSAVLLAVGAVAALGDAVLSDRLGM